jgi:hypothetical protein
MGSNYGEGRSLSSHSERYHLPNGGGHRINIHSKFGGKLVSYSCKTAFGATRILYRLDLDRSFRPHGCLAFPHLEGFFLRSGDKEGPLFLRCAAHCKCSVERGILRHAITDKWPGDRRPLMDLDSHHDYQVPAPKSQCCIIASSLYHLGELRCVLELLNLEIEFLNHYDQQHQR